MPINAETYNIEYRNQAGIKTLSVGTERSVFIPGGYRTVMSSNGEEDSERVPDIQMTLDVTGEESISLTYTDSDGGVKVEELQGEEINDRGIHFITAPGFLNYNGKIVYTSE